MEEHIFYHAVTERPMVPGQRLVFDAQHRNGVGQRTDARRALVSEIYAHPDRCDAETLEHHTRVALRELALEELRAAEYPAYPSRMACLYVSPTQAEAEHWAELFALWGRPTFSVVKLSVRGACFTGDSYNCFEATTDHAENLRLARAYWENLPNAEGHAPMVEVLASGEITVLDIVKKIEQNIQ